jgi:hypothetical protein
MIRVHVLSPGFQTPNGMAFLFPLTVWRKALHEQGIDCRIFGKITPDLTACDVLMVDSKFHRDHWAISVDRVVDEFSSFAQHCRVIYCDTTDSSGWIQTELLPVIHLYAKAQLVRDRSVYSRAMYGHRPYTDYFYRKLGVTDQHPEWSTAVNDPALLGKLRVSWNSGLADYSLYGPTRMALYRRAELPGLLRIPRKFTPPSRPRAQDISCRFGVSYPRETVAVQRKLIRERMSGRIRTDKLSRRAYFKELEISKVIVSPFGFGEITLKDFEVFLTGGLLLKPDMSHIETWPNLFRDGQTMVAHRWDLTDFEEVLDRAIVDYPTLREYAARGQEDYRRHLVGGHASMLFGEHLSTLLKDA